MSDRYSGKPFLELLDSYVLDAIGALDPGADARLTMMQPHFRAILGSTGDWRGMVVGRMQFPEGMQGAIREVWQKGAVKFLTAHGRKPDPVEFARVFVDTNFPH